MRKSLPSVLFMGIFFCSCFGKRTHIPDQQMVKRFAWTPVYALDTTYRIVSYSSQARPVISAGKIYAKGNLIFQCEVGKGIHVIDNTNPSTASRIGFLEVKGAEEISIKDNYLFTNNYYDLVVIDISDFQNPVVVSRNKKAFYATTIGAPHTWQLPPDTGYYRCPSMHTDSIVVSWIKDSVYAACYKN